MSGLHHSARNTIERPSAVQETDGIRNVLPGLNRPPCHTVCAPVCRSTATMSLATPVSVSVLGWPAASTVSASRVPSGETAMFPSSPTAWSHGTGRP